MSRPILRNAVYTAGEGTPVLLLHGSASSSSMWTPVINALKPRFRLIAPDLIGYGRTEPWPEACEFRLEDELRLAERLPNASLQVVEGANHLLPATHHRVLSALLLEELT
jgi:pimeloyl-ACP methyl ester carboxylesterase